MELFTWESVREVHSYYTCNVPTARTSVCVESRGIFSPMADSCVRYCKWS